MERILNLKKGDKVVIAIEPTSNASRYVSMAVSNIENWTFNGTVTTVSKKYITVDFGRSSGMKFVVDDDYRNKYTCGGADYKLYSSFEEVYEKFKSQELYDEIKSMMYSRKNNYSLETLEKVFELLKKERV